MVGLALAVLGAVFTAGMWHTALTEHYYYRKASAIFPAFAILGLGLLVFPIDVEELRERYGVEKLERFEHYPLAWKVLMFVAIAAGIANWFAISRLGE
jgi:hypothetical protein